LSDTVGVNILYCLPRIVVEEELLVNIKMYLNFTSCSVVIPYYKLPEIQPYFRTESSAYHILLTCDTVKPA
jgi:hypothetical protein